MADTDPFLHLLQGAVRAHQLGDFGQAEKIYREVLGQVPGHADTLNLLAVLCHQTGRAGEAVSLFNDAIAQRPEIAHLHANLGNVLNDLHREPEAEIALRKALELNPESPEAWNNLGNSLAAQFRREEAEQCYLRALEKKPDYLEAHSNLGNLLGATGRFEEAAQAYRAALSIQPANASTRTDLAALLMDQGRYSEAEEELLSAIQADPDLVGALFNLGLCRLHTAQFGSAATAFERVVEIDPKHSEALHQLGVVNTAQGNHQAAVDAYVDSLTNRPQASEVHSDLLLTLNYVTGLDPRDLFDQHLEWSRLHTRRQLVRSDWKVDRDPDRRLRIGFVSPDFRSHSVAFFLSGPWEEFDRSQVAIYGYSDVTHRDFNTERFASGADGWREITGLSDDSVESLIRADQIDILVDLAGHTAHNRMPLFSMKCAPVQAAYIGYPNTTGLLSVDYRFTDAWADPIGETEAIHTEELLRLPEGFLCYTPPIESPDLASVPDPSGRPFTFGSFNNLAKMNDDVVALWGEVLNRAPGTCLFLKSRGLDDVATHEMILDRFESVGIARDRIRTEGGLQPTSEHLASYLAVDLALDPFPFNGATTTFEALWMGTPVLTLAGNRHAGRVGVSTLSRLGMSDLIASTAEEFVKKALEQVEMGSRSAGARQTLRDRMAGSSLVQPGPVTRSLEHAFRAMWKK